MGKQTNKKNSNFGGVWTEKKLIIIEKYLNFYTTALKKQKFTKVYIDAFAGSGFIEKKNGEVLIGSALLSLNYEFDEYYFLDINKDNLFQLEEQAKILFPNKINKIRFIHGDSNTELKMILKGMNEYQRGVIFLDPFSMELEWDILNLIQITGILDIWYLFPFSAVNRNLYKDGKIPQAIKDKLNIIFGDDEWETALYKKTPQTTLDGDRILEKADADKIRNYILTKMEKIFPYVSKESTFLKTDNNSPLFLLCYAISNPSPSATSLGDKVVKDIIRSIK